MQEKVPHDFLFCFKKKYVLLSKMYVTQKKINDKIRDTFFVLYAGFSFGCKRATQVKNANCKNCCHSKNFANLLNIIKRMIRNTFFYIHILYFVNLTLKLGMSNCSRQIRLKFQGICREVELQRFENQIKQI